MNYEALIIFGVMAGMSILREHWHNKEKKIMLNRCMARNYQEYEYYNKAFKGEVKEMEKLRDEARDDRQVEEMEEEVTPREEANILGSFDEDWDKDDIDMPKLKEKVERKHG